MSPSRSSSSSSSSSSTTTTTTASPSSSSSSSSEWAIRIRKDPTVHNALGSAAASVISRIFTHPLDTAKARLQAPVIRSSATTVTASSGSGTIMYPYRGPLDVLRKTWRTEGIRGLYRGFGVILVGGTPGTMLYLCSYEVIKQRLSRWWEGIGLPWSMPSSIMSTQQQQLVDNNKGKTSASSTDEYFVVHFCSGMLAETVACIIYVPVDVIKERLQVQHRQQQQLAAAATTTTTTTPAATTTTASSHYYYRGSWDALIQIAKTEGISGIYRGYFATLASFGPFSALYFVFYERSKHWARQYVQQSQQQQQQEHQPKQILDSSTVNLTFPWIVLCSASSGALASWLTSPLDMAKLRLQVQRGQQAAATATATSSSSSSSSSSSTARPPLLVTTTTYRGVWDCLQTAYQQGGVRALFRGAGARVLHFAPATTITMTCYESCRSFFGELLSPTLE